MISKAGSRTIIFENKPSIPGYASVVGQKEGEGPLSKFFDRIISDSYNNTGTYEDAEASLVTEAAQIALKKAGVKPSAVDCAFAGDLLNQCVSSVFGLKDYHIPFLGQYGACSTMAQSLLTAAVFTESGAADKTLACSSSHFASAQRQYRFPMEYGEVRTPTSQWTVTGAGACVVGNKCGGPKITAATIGKIVDLEITDVNNMGAAMAPAASDTIAAFFKDTGEKPSDYDLILTGDLGAVGSKNLCDLLITQGIDITQNHNDCGLLIFNRDSQEVNAGGSGCGCCASVLCSKILNELQCGALNKILFIATGALLSTTTAAQKKTIPSIAHLMRLER